MLLNSSEKLELIASYQLVNRLATVVLHMGHVRTTQRDFMKFTLRIVKSYRTDKMFSWRWTILYCGWFKFHRLTFSIHTGFVSKDVNTIFTAATIIKKWTISIEMHFLSQPIVCCLIQFQRVHLFWDTLYRQTL